MATTDTDYELVIPTAKLVAFLRARTSIPYCREIAELCDVATVSQAYFEKDPGDVSGRRALVELRFEALNVLIRSIGMKQVLELATGLAPRGLVLSEDQSMTVIETDLPPMLAEKRRIVEAITESSPRGNYRLCTLNALYGEEFFAAVHSLKAEPVICVHEGMMQYFNPADKAVLAQNIRALLQRFGGAWITSDVIVRDCFDRFYTSEEQAAMIQAVATMTGCNVVENSFATWEEAIEFFDRWGFTVERLKQIDLFPEIRVYVSDPQVIERIEYEEVWVMRLKA